MEPATNIARDAREPGWFWADNELIDLYGPLIGAIGVAVYVTLARYADAAGRAFPSYQTIADRLGVSRPTVIKKIKQMEDLGLIAKETRDDPAGDAASNVYVLTPIARHQKAVAVGGGKAALPPPSKGDLPPSKAALPQVVNDVYPNKTHGNKTDHGGGGDARARKKQHPRHVAFLLDQGMGAAEEFSDLDPQTAIDDFTNRRAAGQTIALIVRAWRSSRPEKDQPYVRPVQPEPAADEPRRSRSYPKRAASGQRTDDMPGWMRKELGLS